MNKIKPYALPVGKSLGKYYPGRCFYKIQKNKYFTIFAIKLAINDRGTDVLKRMRAIFFYATGRAVQKVAGRPTPIRPS